MALAQSGLVISRTGYQPLHVQADVCAMFPALQTWQYDVPFGRISEVCHRYLRYWRDSLLTLRPRSPQEDKAPLTSEDMGNGLFSPYIFSFYLSLFFSPVYLLNLSLKPFFVITFLYI